MKHTKDFKGVLLNELMYSIDDLREYREVDNVPDDGWVSCLAITNSYDGVCGVQMYERGGEYLIRDVSHPTPLDPDIWEALSGYIEEVNGSGGSA